MAVAVSNEWKDNQGATIRRRGFVNVELGDDDNRYTDFINVTDLQNGVQTEDYFFIASQTLEECNYVSFFIWWMDDPGYKTIYLELETTSIDRNVQYEVWRAGPSSHDTVQYSDNRTKISFAIPDNRSAIQIKITQWCKANELVKIKSVSFGKNITIPSNQIKSVTHNRSYDPMCFELPQNNISMDIFNFDGLYTPLYEDYTNERIRIKVEYGYVLSNTTEIIQGGYFYTKDIQNDEGILNIVGDNSLTLIDDDKSYSVNVGGGTIFSGSGGNLVTANDVTNDMPLVSFEFILADIVSYFNINVISNSDFNNMKVLYGALSGKRKEIMQQMVNASLQKFIIGRYDELNIISTTNSQASSKITLLNSLSKPTITMTKKIRQVEITAFDLDLCETKTYTANTNRAPFVNFVDIENMSKMCLKSVTTAPTYTSHNASNITSITRNATGYYVTTSLDISGTSTLILYLLTGDFPKKVYPVNETGEICDINNNVAPPNSVEKVITYFSNRKMYEMNVRGDPARDVGDYVWMSQVDDNDEDTYKKGLVLSSELIFDGSFKENVTVRIIENEFEAVEE